MNSFKLSLMKIPHINGFCARNLSIKKVKYAFDLKEDTESLFENGTKYRHHPGRRHNPCVSLPLKLQITSLSVINKYKSKRFRNDIKRINREFLEVFVENEKYKNMASNKKKIQVDSGFDESSNIKEKNPTNLDFRERTKLFLSEVYNNYECAAYMASRLPANYAALSYIFNEIRNEEPEFVPQNLFDFGSGTGSTIWAASEHWKDSFNEIFCVDLNENMNDLSKELLQKGTTYDENILQKIFYRQFLPAKHKPSYDLVVSAFSLLDLPDTRNRIHVVENLWQKTSGMLVLVEHGSNAGFTAIMEARNFLLQISKAQLDPLVKEDQNSDDITTSVSKSIGSIVAPCPHEFICPRQLVTTRKSYCNFSLVYNEIDYGQQNLGIKKENFAYLVMKKDSSNGQEQKSWPRLVESVLKNKGHTICNVCASDGLLKQIIVSKSNSSRHLYRCARKSKQGDKLPVNINEIIIEK